MSISPINPALKDLPVYHPGRPIEEVARELGLPAERYHQAGFQRKPARVLRRLALAAMRKALPQMHLYPDGNAFYLKQKLAARLELNTSQPDPRQRLQ